MKLKGLISRTRAQAQRQKTAAKSTAAYTPLDWKDIEKRANALADRIEGRFEELAHILLAYESYEVVHDETARTLDILRNLKENKDYFKTRIGEVTAFLPRNQPLYALTCFVLVPSFQASAVHFRIPHSMRTFFPKLLALLEIHERFPNVVVSHKERSEFMAERSAVRVDPKTGDTRPLTEAVIFTGTPVHADQLRLIFDERTLFITNGSGHNPVVVAPGANVHKAVEAAVTLQLYNQGQDCAAPNSILVHKSIYKDFLRLVRDEFRAVRVGSYADRANRVGPISDPKDLVRVQDLLIRNREWLDPTTPGIIRAHDAIVEPTIIAKPLREGGNFAEVFAPIMFVQRYDDDKELAQYFEHPSYAMNAMYVTVYGSSKYVMSLIGRRFGGKLLHDRQTIKRNTHLHADGIERGTEPYGGFGYGASNLSFAGKITPKPTLPQRDIYEHIAKPLSGNKAAKAREDAARFTKIVEKDIHKLLRTRGSEGSQDAGNREGDAYIDSAALKPNGHRYLKLQEDFSFRLLPSPNVKFAARLKPDELAPIRALRKTLQKAKLPSAEKFNTLVYALPKEAGATDKRNKELQLRFFQNVYQLLLGERSGPRLAQFLSDIDRRKACELLDV